METASVDRFGRVVIPKRVRDDLGLEPGTVLQVREERDGVRLEPVRGAPSVVNRGGVLVFCGEARGDVGGALRDHRAGRIRRLLPRRRT